MQAPAKRVVIVAVAAAVLLAAGAAVACVLLAGAGPGPALPPGGPPGPATIELLPSEGSPSSCIVDQLGEPRPTLTLANATLQANTYDVPTGTTGHAGMCYYASNGTMYAYANWTKVGATGGWFSYPQVTYGVDTYDGAYTTYTPQSQSWSLPQSWNQTLNESLWVTAAYDLRAPPSSDVDGYDLSFDDFLSEGLPPTYEVAPFVEIEIFLAHNISYPFSWVHWHTSTLVNGSLVDEPWDVAYWCHGADNGTNGNVSFDFSLGGQATHGIDAGTVGINLSALFAEVGTLLSGASCWTGPTSGLGAFYLDEEDLGSEDGAVGGTSYDYNWTVSAYCLHTLVAHPTVATVACPGAVPPRADGRPSVGGTASSAAVAPPPGARPRNARPC
jgi:hypothetical protein